MYRPKTFEEIYHQDQAVSAFKQCVKTGQLPHLLLFGPQGTGKTTCIQALAHQLFGPLFYKERVFEINASSERGVQVIRERVKPIAQRKISISRPDGYEYPVPPLQIIILEEADALTRDAQAALRRIIEDYSRNTRIALLCNYPSQIIAPILSRCAKFRFAPLPVHLIAQRLLQIAQKEQVSIGENILHQVASQCNGDMRKAVTQFQMLSQIADTEKGMLIIEQKHLDNLFEVQGVAQDSEIEQIVNKISTIKEETKFLQFVDQTVDKNYDSEELADKIFHIVISSQVSDTIRCAASAEYAKFGAMVARRATEAIALRKYLVGLRVAFTCK